MPCDGYKIQTSQLYRRICWHQPRDKMTIPQHGHTWSHSKRQSSWLVISKFSLRNLSIPIHNDGPRNVASCNVWSRFCSPQWVPVPRCARRPRGQGWSDMVRALNPTPNQTSFGPCREIVATSCAKSWRDETYGLYMAKNWFPWSNLKRWEQESDQRMIGKIVKSCPKTSCKKPTQFKSLLLKSCQIWHILNYLRISWLLIPTSPTPSDRLFQGSKSTDTFTKGLLLPTKRWASEAPATTCFHSADRVTNLSSMQRSEKKKKNILKGWKTSRTYISNW